MTWEGYDTFYVYELVDPRGDVVFYIGKTATPNTRFSAHKSSPDSAAYGRLKEIARVGMEARMNVIGEFKSEAEALDYEGYLISKTPGLLNRTGPYLVGSPPTAPFVRPILAVDDLEYDIEGEPDYDRRIRRLYEAMGGDVPEDDIRRVLETLDVIRHEDSEYESLSDE